MPTLTLTTSVLEWRGSFTLCTLCSKYATSDDSKPQINCFTSEVSFGRSLLDTHRGHHLLCEVVMERRGDTRDPGLLEGAVRSRLGSEALTAWRLEVRELHSV